jgi:hypothetical protein
VHATACWPDRLLYNCSAAASRKHHTDTGPLVVLPRFLVMQLLKGRQQPQLQGLSIEEEAEDDDGDGDNDGEGDDQES